MTTATSAAVEARSSASVVVANTYARDSYAEAGYQRSCEAMKRVSRQYRWWTIWQQGQDWYAELSATGLGKLPPSVAETFARALKSTAWDDCSGLR
jgi:hypothetical protein